jgi:hypothetical protein
LIGQYLIANQQRSEIVMVSKERKARSTVRRFNIGRGMENLSLSSKIAIELGIPSNEILRRAASSSRKITGLREAKITIPNLTPVESNAPSKAAH